MQENNRQRPKFYNGNKSISAKQVTERFDNNIDQNVNFASLVKKEQDSRLKWQDKQLSSYNLNVRLGQICALIYNIALLYFIKDLINNGEKDLAVRFFLINALLLLVAVIFTSFERRISFRKPNRKNFEKKYPKKSTPKTY